MTHPLDRPIWNAFADNLGAISPCGRLGFAARWQPLPMVFERMARRGESWRRDQEAWGPDALRVPGRSRGLA